MGKRRRHSSDLTLARRIETGDRRAADRFVDLYLERVYSFSYYRVTCVGGSREDVEDVCQDAMTAAIQSISGFRGDSSLFVWLCGIASNKAREFRRRAMRHYAMDRALDAAEPKLLDALARLDETPLPQEVLEREEVKHAVGLAMSSLPQRYRAVLDMKYMQDRSVREIADLLRSSEKAVESVLSRARAAFREAIGALAEGANG